MLHLHVHANYCRATIHAAYIVFVAFLFNYNKFFKGAMELDT